MKSPAKGYRVVAVSYSTDNPDYPEAQFIRHESKRVCDATFGRKWTIKLITITKVKK